VLKLRTLLIWFLWIEHLIAFRTHYLCQQKCAHRYMNIIYKIVKLYFCLTLVFHWLIYCLYNDADTKWGCNIIWRYIAASIGWEWIKNWNGYGRKRSWSNLTYSLDMRLERLRKPKKNHSQDGRWRCLDSNRAASSTCHLFHTGFLPGLLFNPTDRGDMFLRNVSWLFNGLHGVTSQKTELFITTAARNSDHIMKSELEVLLHCSWRLPFM
jgi:hypothetical protein